MRAPRRHRRPLAGFTLIELLIVIIIIGILVAIGVPAYLQYQAKANDRDAQVALQVAYKAAIAGDTEVNSARFPVASTVVNDVKADEPAASIARGDCIGTVVQAPVKQVLVDPSSTASQLTMCIRSASGTIWKLSGPLTGTPAISDGSTVALALAGNEITDATRAAAVAGDGLASDSSTGVWESTTNLAKNSGAEGGAVAFTGTHAVSSITADTTHVLFGAKSFEVTGDGVTGSPGIYPIDTGSAIPNSRFPVVPGTSYSESEFIWTAAPLTFRPVIEWYQADGATRSAITASTSGPAQTTVAGQWTRVYATGVAPSDAAGMTPTFYVNGTSGATWWNDGIEVEAKPFPTPYVATNGATASRAGGWVHAPASLLSASQGWVAIRVRVNWAAASRTDFPQLFDWQTDVGNRLGVFWNGPASKWVTNSRTGGGTGNSTAPSALQSFTSGAVLTVIGSWYGSTLAISVNGSPFQTQPNTSPVVPAGSTFELGALGTGTECDCDILWAATGTGTLSDPDAATINGWGSSDPKRSSFPSSAQATMAWDGVSSSGSLK